jgi:ribosomal-protein-alanine N-acetyltransferase
MKIRPATAADLASIVSIERSSDTAAHWNEAEYATALHGRRLILVAELASNIVGFLVASTATEEWELENIAVDPTQRKRGVGRALMAALIDYARLAGAVEVRQEIRQSNVSAQALAEQTGFLQEGKRTGYYASPSEDALLFKHLLTEGNIRN